MWKICFAKTETKPTQGIKKGPNIILTERFKNMFDYRQPKGLTIGKVGTIFGAVVTVVTVFSGLLGLMDDFEDEGGNKVTEKIRHFRKERKRGKMIETGVGPGLAWLYYVYALQHVLSVDIKDKVIKSGLLSSRERKNMPMKVYTVIPRKCRLMDDRGWDENIEQIGRVTLDDKKKITIPLLRIKDGPKDYYCLFECPTVLKTMNNVNDIQMAGITRSKYSIFDFPWNQNSIVQLFNTDTKLVQLMRFYYALNSILCLKKEFREKTRLVLFNESEKTPSEVLLQAIKEDLKVDGSEQIKHKVSMIQNKLLSAEEKISVYYDYDLFVTYLRGVNDEGNKIMETGCDDLIKDIHDVYEDTPMRILSMDTCLGKDWLTNLKYAATKCRWIVFLEPKQSESELFTSHKVTDSINSTLESKKVQTMAIINPRDNMHIFDDLRWITCIPYQDKKNHILTLHRVLTGRETEIENHKELYIKPGEVAIGLAWIYAADMCNFLTLLSKHVKKRKKDLQCPSKLLFVFPENIKPHHSLESEKNQKEQGVDDCKTEVQNLRGFKVFKPSKPRPDELQMYGINDHTKRNEVIWHCEYPRPLTVIRQMKEDELLTEDQMNSEVQIFCKNVQRIIEILLPDQTDNYEFIHCNDTTGRPIVDQIINIHQRYYLDDKHEEILSVYCSF